MTGWPTPALSRPAWPRCEQDADTATGDPGCPATPARGHASCLAHLGPAARDDYFAGLAPGADVDLRGATLDGGLVDRLVNAVRDPDTGRPRFGRARFHSATFTAPLDLREAAFDGDADFTDATFTDTTTFIQAAFRQDAIFDSATFAAELKCNGATFAGRAMFSRATFTGDAPLQLGGLPRQRVVRLHQLPGRARRVRRRRLRRGGRPRRGGIRP